MIWHPDGSKGKPRSTSRSSPSRLPCQCAQLEVEAELLAVIADEVQDGQHGLVLRPPQPSPELLQEDRGALGGSEEQHRVDIGNVDALVEDVDREDCLDVGLREDPADSAPALLGALRRSPLRSATPASLKAAAMYSACATLTQKPSACMASGFGHLVAELPQDHRRSGRRCRCRRSPAQHRRTGHASSPPAEVGAVGHGEVVERTQQVGAQRIPQPQLGRDPTVEERAYVDPVGALGCRRQPQQLARSEMLDADADSWRPRRGETRRSPRSSKASLGMVATPCEESDCMLAKTCSPRSGRMPPTYSSPNVASVTPRDKSAAPARGSRGGGRRRAATACRCLDRAAGSRGRRSRSCRCRWPLPPDCDDDRAPLARREPRRASVADRGTAALRGRTG